MYDKDRQIIEVGVTGSHDSYFELKQENTKKIYWDGKDFEFVTVEFEDGEIIHVPVQQARYIKTLPIELCDKCVYETLPSGESFKVKDCDFHKTEKIIRKLLDIFKESRKIPDVDIKYASEL